MASTWMSDCPWNARARPTYSAFYPELVSKGLKYIPLRAVPDTLRGCFSWGSTSCPRLARHHDFMRAALHSFILTPAYYVKRCWSISDLKTCEKYELSRTLWTSWRLHHRSSLFLLFVEGASVLCRRVMAGRWSLQTSDAACAIAIRF